MIAESLNHVVQVVAVAGQRDRQRLKQLSWLCERAVGWPKCEVCEELHFERLERSRVVAMECGSSERSGAERGECDRATPPAKVNGDLGRWRLLGDRREIGGTGGPRA